MPECQRIRAWGLYYESNFGPRWWAEVWDPIWALYVPKGTLYVLKWTLYALQGPTHVQCLGSPWGIPRRSLGHPWGILRELLGDAVETLEKSPGKPWGIPG